MFYHVLPSMFGGGGHTGSLLPNTFTKQCSISTHVDPSKVGAFESLLKPGGAGRVAGQERS